MEKFSKIILNVPHSSIENWNVGWDNPMKLYPHVKDLTDWHTDLLFASSLCTMVRFPYSRFYCDAERLINDPMEKLGQGIVYAKYGDCERDIDSSSIFPLWENHQNALSKEINGDDVLIIDCHSFPSHVSKDIDICIGFNDDWSRVSDDVIDFVSNSFKNIGLSVGINNPYSNSITPKSDFNYKSVMIEINKRIYMDEKTLLPNKIVFNELNIVLCNIYKQLLQ